MPRTMLSSSMPAPRLALAARALARSRTCARLARRRAAGFATACVFDIDGVLFRGSFPLPHARESLDRLDRAGVPWLLLTNGGGEPETVKAAKLGKLLGRPVDVAQVVLSHTPMRALCAPLAARRVLILGCRDVEAVAASYGLRRAVTARQLLHDEPARYPFLDVSEADRRAGRLPDRDEAIAAVMVLHDPNSWGLEIQVAMDVLRGGTPFGAGDNSGKAQLVPYYSSNADLLFAATYPVPRLAGGSFTVALRALWRAQHGAELEVTQFGKPERRTFDFARSQLALWSGSPADAFSRIFMIGDNPRSDIRGANAAGAPWHSVLVRTGVFRGEANDAEDPAKTVVAGVKEAVDVALARGGP